MNGEREMEHRNISLGDQVFERLEKDILAGKYERGALTSELKLCAELGVSRTPVREALGRLEAEHLVEETGKGIMILGITKEDLKDCMEVRVKLDGQAAARCAENITDAQLKQLKEILDLQEFYLTKEDSDSVKTMDSRFHEMIYRFSGSTVFYGVLSPLHNKVQRYRKAALETSGRAEKSIAEHRAIYDAIAAHDPTSAAKAMLTHAENASASLMRAVEHISKE